jgi:pimeloyl-ACP methyl ester carboxylesterase
MHDEMTFDAIVRDMEQFARERDAMTRYLRSVGLYVLVRSIGPYAVEDAIAIAFEYDERHARRIRALIADAATEVGVDYEPELQKRPNRPRRRAERQELFTLGAPCADPRHVNNLGSTLRRTRDGGCIECGRPPSEPSDLSQTRTIPEPY